MVQIWSPSILMKETARISVVSIVPKEMRYLIVYKDIYGRQSSVLEDLDNIA